MPKQAKALSARAVLALSHSGSGPYTRHAVGGVPGLLLHITPSGARSWVLRATLNGRRGEWGLGAFPEVPLADARQKAIEARSAIAAGVDPTRRERAKEGLTFADAVEQYCETKLAAYRNAKHRAQWRSTLETYANPVLGKLDVSHITVHDVLKVLEPIWTEKTETASRVRGRIESVLAWATVQGFRDASIPNAATWKNNLDAILPAPDALKRVNNGGGDHHHPALALSDAPRWFALLRTRKGVAARALEFQMLTASRSGAVRLMKWSELDLQAGIWTVPVGREASKITRVPHRVPLTRRMRELIAEQEEQGRGSEYVFAAPRDGALSDMSLSAVMKRIHEEELSQGRKGFLDPRSGLPAVPHGACRSTFRDWVSECTDYPAEMGEIALSHQVGTEVTRAYARSDQVENRRQMMEDWGAFLSGHRQTQDKRIAFTKAELVALLERCGALSNSFEAEIEKIFS